MKKFSIINYKFKMGIGLVFSIALLVLGLYQPAKAATVTAGPLSITFDGPQLFSETNMYPGMAPIVKTVSVNNNGIYPHSFSIATNGVSGSLAYVLQIEPRDGGTAIWNETLASLASLPNGSKVIIPSIAPGATKNLQIAAILPSTAGNGLQGQATTSFSFNMGTESTDQPEPTVNPSPPVTLGTSGSAAVTGQRAVGGVASEGAETDDLNVIGENDDNILGTSDEGTKGVTTTARDLCFWWIVVLIILVAFLAIYHRYIREERPVFWWFWPVVMAAVLFFVHLIFDRYYEPTILCRWFWTLEAVALVIYYIYENYNEAKKEEK